MSRGERTYKAAVKYEHAGMEAQEFVLVFALPDIPAKPDYAATDASTR